ncbi:phage tail tape measure protein [Bacillus sp. JJ1533]|uniref:phage tail tape measure protein n=1 Tax=Bacillus sp. JJ1533 TaxID=3122959 RepID=UPI002FFF0F23
MAKVGEIRARLVLDKGSFNKGMNEAREELDKTKNSAKNTEKAIDGIQRASLAIGTAVAVGVGIATKIAADFEQQMSRVKAISGATDAEFKLLEQAALDLGASTSKSASEVALGFEDLAAMGFNVNEMLAAMPGVISASEAAGANLAQTASIVAAALNGFHLEASEANRVADVLAMTANVSAASMDDLGYAFKYAAPIAQTLGISMEELASATGIMVDAGMEGSQAGTTLRMALQRLADPTKEGKEALKDLGVSTVDAKGNFLDLSEILPQFVDGLNDMTDAQKVAELSTIFGTEAASGMLSVIGAGPEKFNDFTKALENSAGSSKETADIMKDNLKGSFEEFQGALETLGIKVGNEFLPKFREIVETGTEIFESLGKLNPEVYDTGIKMAGASVGVALAATSLMKVVTALKGLSLSPVGLVITGLSLLAGVVVGAKSQYDDFNKVSLENAEAMMKQQEELSSMTEEFDNLKLRSQLTNDEFARFLDISDEMNRTTDPQILEALRQEHEKLAEKSGLSADELQRMVDLNGKIIEVVPDANIKISEQGNAYLESTDKVKEFNKEQLEAIRLELEIQQAKAESKMADLLREEKSLKEDINKLESDRQKIDEEITEYEKIIFDQTRKINEAKKQGKEEYITLYEQEIDRANMEIKILKDQNIEILDKLKKKKDELGLTQEELKQLDEVKDKMIDLELAQAGLNTKKGEGLKTVENEILKLKHKKDSMIANTDEAFKNTTEYQDGIRAIDEQIGSLETVRDRVKKIISDASVLNSELGKNINKTVYVTQRTKSGSYLTYHTGGIVGENPLNQMPKLHTGGLASQVMQMNTPMHNEVDVRLLKDEMVLTQAQQANLMRLIDAGISRPNQSGTPNYDSMDTLISQLIALSDRPISVSIDGKEVAKATYEDVTYYQDRYKSRKRTTQGRQGGGII